MKTAVPLTALVATAAALAIAPAIHERDAHQPVPAAGGPDTGPTVDDTSTRSEWITSYTNNQPPTVDDTSTRSQWVTSYTNSHGGAAAQPPTVDDTSTRSQWVTSYTNSKWSVPHVVDHWLPSGPGYLDMDALDEGYKAHLMIMHDSSSWLHTGISMAKRFFGGDAE